MIMLLCIIIRFKIENRPFALVFRPLKCNMKQTLDEGHSGQKKDSMQRFYCDASIKESMCPRIHSTVIQTHIFRN